MKKLVEVVSDERVRLFYSGIIVVSVGKKGISHFDLVEFGFRKACKSYLICDNRRWWL